MKKVFWTNNFSEKEKGSAIVIALLVLTLLTAFVALAVTRTTNETIATSNDAAESRAFAAAQASLEVMTRNFDKIFEEKLSPAPADLTKVETSLPPDFDTEYEFRQTITPTSTPKTVQLTGGPYQGLNAVRDEWQVDTTATERGTGVQVALRRHFYNNRIPIFQFGIFYNDDLEFHPGPRFDFGGRVHANGNMFLMAQDGLYFSSRVSAVGQIITDIGRNGKSNSSAPGSTPQWGEKVYIKNGSGTYVQLKYNMGSVLNTVPNGTPVFNDPARPDLRDTDMPTLYRNSSWASNKELFQGNLLSEQKRLDLPLASRANGEKQYNELIKRSVNVGDLWNNGTSVTAVTAADADSVITMKERYANKKGLRVSLADSKAKLPGCAAGAGGAVVGACGVRLDGAASGDGSYSSGARGYQPKPMRGSPSYQATRLNGDRFYTPGREVWIKIELVGLNATTNTVETTDVTEDILSLGVTEPAPCFSGKFGLLTPGYYNRCNTTTYEAHTDSRSIIKLQRFAMPGVAVTASDTNFMTRHNWNSVDYNIVQADERNVPTTSNPNPAWGAIDNGALNDSNEHKYPAFINDSTKERRIVPFPIKIFDSREGVYNFNISYSTVYPGGQVPWAGVMSLIDIDVANLRRFLNGDFNAMMPASGTPFTTAKGRELRHTDVPEANGWVLYVSDRRGDMDFDGEYDMEDIYGDTDNILQPGEDVNFNGVLERDFFSGEAVRYTGSGSYASPALAATVDNKGYFRRGVRLINGTVLPGKYDPTNSLNTKGFTVASENGVYVLGNYNATGIASVGTPTASTLYNPQGDNASLPLSEREKHIPASVVADAITILSNGWQDSRSFAYPFDSAGGKRRASETTVRFAMLAGDARSSFENTPHQGNSDQRLCGGVHNFKRFLEDWGSVRLNYAGSIINLYNARNSNGSYKNNAAVRNPPVRNWVFDTSFLDPTRLPPGTPFFQNIQLTGFQRIN